MNVGFAPSVTTTCGANGRDSEIEVGLQVPKSHSDSSLASLRNETDERRGWIKDRSCRGAVASSQRSSQNVARQLTSKAIFRRYFKALLREDIKHEAEIGGRREN